MRENMGLYRGKRKHDGEWIYGSFFREDDVVTIFPKPMCIGCGFGGLWWIDDGFDPVDPETVGQFVGMTDKNGKNIFEGDIVHVLGNQQVEDWKNVNYIGSIAFLDAGFCVIDGTIEDHAFRRYQLPRRDFSLEVIGNIHDNPELLEVSK